MLVYMYYVFYLRILQFNLLVKFRLNVLFFHVEITCLICMCVGASTAPIWSSEDNLQWLVGSHFPSYRSWDQTLVLRLKSLIH